MENSQDQEPIENALTIFEAGTKERQTAIRNLLRGQTPLKEVRKKPQGGAMVNFVNTYYMTRQLSLITGFRWSSEYLEDKARPNWDNPVEVGVKVRVTIWDAKGNAYMHTCWGKKDVIRYAKDDPKGKWKAGDIISLFNDLKSAESDAIKKCCSYFGIANDIYGGRELDFFGEEPNEESGENGTADMGGNEASVAFGKFLTEKHIAVSKALEILKAQKLSEIADYKTAHDLLVKELDL